MVFMYELSDAAHSTDLQVFYFNIMDMKSKNKSHEHSTPISYSR